MALSEGFQRYLGAIGGDAASTLAGGLIGGFTTYGQQEVERRRKKKEEEEANRKAGLAAALDFATKQGRGEEASDLYRQVYGISAPAGYAEDVTRAAERARITEDLTLLPYMPEEERARMGEQLGIRFAQARGETPYLPGTEYSALSAPQATYVPEKEPGAKPIPTKPETGLGGLSARAYEKLPAVKGPDGKLIYPAAAAAASPYVPGKPTTITDEEYARYVADLSQYNPAAFQQLVRLGDQAAIMEAGGNIAERPQGLGAVEKAGPSGIPSLTKPEQKPRYRFTEKEDTKVARDFTSSVKKDAAALRNRLDQNFNALTDEEKIQKKPEYDEKLSAINVYENAVLAAKSTKDIERPSTVFVGKTIKGETLAQRGRALADRREYNRVRLTQFAANLKIKAGTLANSVRQTANAFIINTERNVILRNNTALRGEALDLLVQRYNSDTDLKVWAQSDRTQAEAGKITVAAAKTANDNVSKLPQFGKAVRDEIYASGDEARIKKFEDDYRTAVAAETTSLAQQQLDKLKKSTFKPARIERRGGAAPVRAATGNQPANAKPAGAKPPGLAGRRDID